MAEIFDPVTRYEYEVPLPTDIARALELNTKFKGLGLVSSMEQWRPWLSAWGSTGF